MTITETLKQLRTESGWYVGDKRASEVLEAYAHDRDATIAQLEGMLRQAKEQMEIERETNKILRQAAITAGDNARAERAYSDERSALLIECSKEREALKERLAAMQSARDDAVQAAHILAQDLANRDEAIEMAESWGESGIETMDDEALGKYERLKGKKS